MKIKLISLNEEKKRRFKAVYKKHKRKVNVYKPDLKLDKEKKNVSNKSKL
tara:strand:+ start:830 stop:979 length:150 start_codon:yes stop_codon:yes gene_type:complete